MPDNIQYYNQQKISYLSYMQLRGLRVLAEKATPGYWTYNRKHIYLLNKYAPERVEGECGNMVVCALDIPSHIEYKSTDEQDANGYFIAHTNPVVVKYLVDEILSLRGELAEMARQKPVWINRENPYG